MMQHQDEIYYCIATNDNDLTLAEIIKLHRQRGETSENKIKELKTIRYKLYNIAGKVITHAKETIRQRAYEESLQ